MGYVAELRLNQTSGAPWYFQGVLTAGLQVAGAKELKVDVRDHDGIRCTLVIRWQ